ncbi:AsmA-like C-terminal region-containing protein, partial [Nostoc sp. NIES-2111]
MPLASVPSERPARRTARGLLPVAGALIAAQLALATGGPVASGEGEIDLTFRSEGRSPGAALAAAQGEGKFAFDDFHLLGLTPAAFTTALAAARDAAGIGAAFPAMHGGDGLEFGAVSGTISLAGGEMTFAPIQHVDADAGTIATALSSWPANQRFGSGRLIARGGVSMCDYSLENQVSRPATVGDKLVTSSFQLTPSRGFCAENEAGVAVCLLPGTELAFAEPVRYNGLSGHVVNYVRSRLGQNMVSA